MLTTGALNVSPKIDELLRGTVADQLSSRLLGLAQELYDLVLDELEDMSYMALLSCAVTCKAALGVHAGTSRHISNAMSPGDSLVIVLSVSASMRTSLNSFLPEC